MKKITLIITPLFLLLTAACSTPTAQIDAQQNNPAIDQLPVNILPPAANNSAALYYTDDEITQLTNCAVRAKQTKFVAQKKRDGTTYLSKNDWAMDVFKSCAATKQMTDERVDRAAFCMSSQFLAKYIWTAKQQGASEKEVRHRLAESGNKAVPLIAREIYSHDAESLDDAGARLWNSCIHNFKKVK